MTGQADPQWLTAAITAARQPRARAQRGEDIIETAIRAALPAIREGLAQEILSDREPWEWALAGRFAGDDAARIIRGQS